MGKIININEVKKTEKATETPKASDILAAMDTEEKSIYRICSMKESSGLTWQQIADMLDACLRKSNNGRGRRR